MGADIYIFLEIKRKDKWTCNKKQYFSGYNYTTHQNYTTRQLESKLYSAPFDRRDYQMFGVLAGVRWNIEPIKPLKGALLSGIS